MFPSALYALLSVLLVSLVSFTGVFALSLKERTLRKHLALLVSLAVGALLGDAFLHLIPEAFEMFGDPARASLIVIGGILVFLVLEEALHWHHHTHAHDEGAHKAVNPTGRMIVVSDGVHNFLDGLIIAGSFLAGIEVGIASTIAVILHEIPQEIGDFGVLLHAGYTKAKALWLNFLSALFAIAGAAVALLAETAGTSLTAWLVPFSAGGFIYVAMSDLIPELQKTTQPGRSLAQLAAVLLGLLAMVALLAVE